MGDRRFEYRRVSPVDCIVEWVDEAGASAQAAGIIEDLSISGARIQMRQTIRVRSIAAVIAFGKSARSKVRYCSRGMSSFAVGVEFEPEDQGVLFHAGEPAKTSR